MKQSLAVLFLCFSACGALAQESSPTRMPWLDRPSNATPMAPLEQAAPINLGELTMEMQRSSGPKAWMDDATKRYRDSSPAAAAEQADYDMQVFISAGMPEGVLRHLFRQAMDFKAGQVRFVVRGFEPQKLGALVSKLRGLFPDPLSNHIALEVDPNAFRTYGVQAVPVFLVREQDKWYEVHGSQSLEVAKKNAQKRGQKVKGEMYAIAEPDVLAVIEERAKKFDWQPVLQRAQQRMAQNLKPGFDLPTVTRSTTTYYVPTFTAPHDIKSPGKDGKTEVLLARAGQTFKLLDHTRLQVPVIVFDPSDSRQVGMVKRWLEQPDMKSADLFVVAENMPSKDGGLAGMNEVAKKLQRPVYPMLAKMSERMGVEAVPAIVEQEGDRLRVRYFDPEKR